ncbi:MAG TPA: SAM-dependent methyltransferase [Acidimicrobiia bacterium]|nr:SAM-dependent methyltransferase [Acidimicrobiia bacterium]
MQAIRAEIAASGPIPFDRFMELALYGPGGFFSGEILRSQKSGDFLTSPEVSPLFGQTIARFVESEYERIGDPFKVVEVGAGSGSLLRPLLEARIPQAQPFEAWAVDVSPAARAALARLLEPARVVSDLSWIPGPIRGVVIANELIDNLPMALAQLTAGGWRERWVGSNGERLAFVDSHPRPEVVEWLERFAGPVETGGWVEVQLQARNWLQDALSRIAAGSLLVIDYGDTADDLAPRRRDGTLRTYRSHHLGPHPLDEPGATDITADVNFSALLIAAEAMGAEVELLRQDDFLSSWGLREQLSLYRRQELELARTGSEMDRLRQRSWRTEAETLLHPRGLGDFRVMLSRITPT